MQIAEAVSQASRHLGRYRLLRTIGQGGMGTIHLAIADGLGDFRKLLVVKELRCDLTTNAQFVAMFFQEAKIAASLNHPNVVHTLEAGQVGGRYYLAMEFLDGQSLGAVLSHAMQAPEVSLELRIQILCEALSGLHYAHELRDYAGDSLKVIHRDVCPQNIVVTYDGQVKVVDFGVAKAADTENTEGHLFKGKLGYAAPEQVDGEELDSRADIFAAGVVLWEMIALRRFSSGPVTLPAVQSRLAGSEPRIAQVVPKVDRNLAAICDRALQVDRSKRFDSAEQFRLALLEYLASRGVRPDQAALANLMRRKFASERKSMHELIHAGLANEPRLHLAADEPLVEHTQSEAVTTVADLSELVEVSRPGTLTDVWPFSSLPDETGESTSSPDRLTAPAVASSKAATTFKRNMVIGAGFSGALLAIILAARPSEPAETLQSQTVTSEAASGSGDQVIPSDTASSQRFALTMPTAKPPFATEGASKSVHDDGQDERRQEAKTSRGPQRRTARRRTSYHPRRIVDTKAAVSVPSTASIQAKSAASPSPVASPADVPVEMGMELPETRPRSMPKVKFDNPFE